MSWHSGSSTDRFTGQLPFFFQVREAFAVGTSMTLADEYRNQFGWRRWARILDELPAMDGKLVLDLGCGVGDLAAALVARGARVIGFDTNETLLEAARARGISGAEFRNADLRER